MVAWLLQNKLITEVRRCTVVHQHSYSNACTAPTPQLNTYVFLVPAHDGQGAAVEHNLDQEDSRPLTELRAELSPAELQSVLSCPAAEDVNELARFATLVQYFRGGRSITDIAQEEQLPRTNILTTIDMFSAVLVTATIPDPT